MNVVRTLSEWSKAVRLRDGSCTKCGSLENLEAHHIKSKSQDPELKLHIDNGITLCFKCHHEHHQNHPNEKVVSEYTKMYGKVAMKKKVKELMDEKNSWRILMEKQIAEAAKELEQKISSLQEANSTLIRANNKLIAENKHLKQAMVEYENAYEKLINKVPV